MKRLLNHSLLSLLFMLQVIPLAVARMVEIEVHGMTCAFCVDSLERKFKKMESVNKVEVSLKLKKIRLETEDNAPTMEVIKQAVLDAGFTPTKISIVKEAIKDKAKEKKKDKNKEKAEEKQ